ncbi:hypothetical protein RCL_jg5018.t1 [Rhizophagus clarus]|uniref:Uncharacterized protein n=1 Tax=Rhizophagus clarus TaxID=94130 RepID=A0A8H3QJV2_9GLOM|nr:hypothetical protein RCL_jg5018.t1 [Rhizophagus clarus]
MNDKITEKETIIYDKRMLVKKRNVILTLDKSDLVYNDDNEIVQLQKRLIHMVKGTKPLHDTRFATSKMLTNESEESELLIMDFGKAKSFIVLAKNERGL